MSKRKNSDPGRVRQLHPTQSFSQMVGDATLAKLGGYIDQQINSLYEMVQQRQLQTTQALFTRIVAIEELLLERFSDLTKDDLVTRVATIQDRNEGFEAVSDGVIEVGDRVRLEIKTKTADQTEFQGSSRFLVDNVGAGSTLGKELEATLIGMRTGEVKETKFGADETLVANVAINKISRKLKVTPVTELASVAKVETAEDADVSVDAG